MVNGDGAAFKSRTIGLLSTSIKTHIQWINCEWLWLIWIEFSVSGMIHYSLVRKLAQTKLQHRYFTVVSNEFTCKIYMIYPWTFRSHSFSCQNFRSAKLFFLTLECSRHPQGKRFVHKSFIATAKVHNIIDGNVKCAPQSKGQEVFLNIVVCCSTNVWLNWSRSFRFDTHRIAPFVSSN